MADLLPVVRGLSAVDISVLRAPCLAAMLAGLLLSPLAGAQTADPQSEAADVQRLHSLLAAYHGEMEAYDRTAPAADQGGADEPGRNSANNVATLPFSPGKIHLNGAEASAVLSRISMRLAEAEPEDARQDSAPEYSIETHLYGTLVGSDSRSLKAVGKNNFVGRARLLPGQTTVRILEHSWELTLPKDASAKDVLVTFYSPTEGEPELYIFAIDDLLAEKNPHIPHWLTDGLKITTRAG